MKLQHISLQHYRNYDTLQLDTPGDIHIFLGKNAQGKTNLLEAIFVLALAKSHRTSKDKELIGWDTPFATIQGAVERRLGKVELQLQFTAQGKKAKINGLEQRKLSDYIGALNAVMFAPEDLTIVKGNPAIRRKFIDMELGQISPTYLHQLSQYQKIVTQRNQYLKTDYSGRSKAMLEVWNEQMAELAVKLTRKREQFIHKLQSWARDIHSGITGEREELTIHYQSSAQLPPDQEDSAAISTFLEQLSKLSDQEFRRGMTLLGPHRDDLAFTINGKDAQSFGSQGQQRTTALSLKLAEIELIREEVGEYPILLLDDVLSELDPYRQSHLLKTIFPKVQTFVTTTSVDGIDEHTLSRSTIYYVEQGQIQKKE